MATIARVQTDDREVNQLQSNIISALNPLLNNPLLFGSILTEQDLAVGTNIIKHGLNRTLQGWFLVRKRATADVWDSQDTNPTPNSTLILNASAAVTVDLYVF